MSLRIALQVVAILVVSYFLLMTILAMGPLGLLFFVPLLVIGAVQVYRSRDGRGSSDGAQPNYCPNCGSAVDVDAFDEACSDDTRDRTSADAQWEVRYCPDCGAPFEPATKSDRDDTADSGSVDRPTNCPDCGAPNDGDRAACEYCDAEL